MSIHFKSYFADISTIKLLGIRDFLIIDCHEDEINSYLFRSVRKIVNPLKMFFLPEYKIVVKRNYSGHYSVDDYEREILLISERYKLKNAALVFIINKYKQFNVTIERKDNFEDDDQSLEDKIKKSIPANFSGSDFIIHYNKIFSNEMSDHYIATVTRKQELEKYKSISLNGLFVFRFAIPFIHAFALQETFSRNICELIDIGIEKIDCYRLNKLTGKLFVDEFYYDNSIVDSMGVNENKIETFLNDKYEEIFLDSGKEGKTHPLYFNNRVGMDVTMIRILEKINNLRAQNYIFYCEQFFKHDLIYSLLSRDEVFNFLIEIEKSPQKKLDKLLTTRILTLIFGLILGLLVVLNGSNYYLNNSIDEIASKKQLIEYSETELKKLKQSNEELKTDLRKLKKIKFNNIRFSPVLKIVEVTKTEMTKLVELKISKKVGGGYQIKLNGEASNKDAVIKFISNLENINEIKNVELLLLDKKKNAIDMSPNASEIFNFAIMMNYNETEK